jgi:hypothetical protein
MSGIKSIAQRAAEATWGFIPGRQVKPVHVANGLFRELTQQTATPTLLRKAAGGFQTGRSRETTSQFRELLRERIIAPDTGDVPLERVEQLRAALDLVFHQDRALFATGSYYSPTLTHRAHTTADPSHSGTGAFLAQVIRAGAPQTTKTLQALLNSESDNLALLASPLIDPGAPPALAEATSEVERRISASQVLPALQQSFENVSTYAEYLEKTVLLQRVVTLGSFGLLLHVAQPFRGQDGDEVERLPLFVSSNAPCRASREASRATYRLASRAMLHAFESSLKAEYVSSGQDQEDDQDYLDLAEQVLFDPTDKNELRSLHQFKLDYRAEKAGDLGAFDSFVRALAPTAIEYVGSSSPSDFFTYLGRLGGICYPRLGGAGDKYYRPAPQFLDMLVASLLQPQEELMVAAFWERAWEQFGVLCGGRRDRDADALQAWGIPGLSVAELSANAEGLNSQLDRMGYVRRFPDGVSLVSSGVS